MMIVTNVSDMIILDFVTQMSMYIARVNDRIIKTLEEIEKDTTTAAAASAASAASAAVVVVVVR